MNLLERVIELRPKPKVWNGEDIFKYCETKLDGIRLTVVKADGDIVAFSRKPRINLAPELFRDESFNELCRRMPLNSCVDGELWVNGQSTDVISHVRRGGELTYTPFAVPFWNGSDLVDESMETIDRLIKQQLLMLGPDRVRGMTKTTEMIEQAKASEIEGFVLKLDHWRNWYKVKPDATLDCIVIGTEEGESKYEGMIGALKIGLVTNWPNVRPIGKVGSGLTDDDRKLNPTDLFGRAIEVKYDSITRDGKMRFPRFIRFRDDKPLRECSMEQIR